ncbi:MAG: DUF3160 domain-containing protein [Lachnospiraceae bacterium]|nr:DUF3160 domain-containing protein [Lachnospiraceae bacterium]
MKKGILSVLLIFVLVFSMVACSSENKKAKADEEEEQTEEKEEKSKKKKKDKDKKEKEDEVYEAVEATERKYLMQDNEMLYDPDLVPSIEPYSVEKDFSNVVYDELFSYLFDPNYEYFYEGNKKLMEGLIKNNFVVANYGNSEFFDVYEGNRYNYFPNFVTVDSLMHTYHIYFSYLMKNTEKDYLADSLLDLSKTMLEVSTEQYRELLGTEWEDAAYKNLVFFYVGTSLLDDSIMLPVEDNELESIVDEEKAKIMEASGIYTCYITDDYEDYTQYKPRGYYEGDELLEKYFRSMMWYGRISFYTDSEELMKSSALIVKALEDSGADTWEGIYNVTSFFSGASDDPGYYEFKGIVDGCFADDSSVSDMAKDDSGLNQYIESVKELKLPEINSVPVWEGENPVKPCFRFMGQRFTIDASIMQNLVYDSVGEKDNGDTRLLPDTLDVAAVLGSSVAEEMLKENGDFEYDGYKEGFEAMKYRFENDDADLWNASLYAGWLNTLRPLLEEKGKGYPSYKLNDEWHKKSLETFLGSYAELKHDTILYAKSVMAEMGDGGYDEIPDDRGYVDPEPVVYSNFANLAKNTKNGLDSFGMLPKGADEDLDLLYDISVNLLEISEKELQCIDLTDDEFDFIREYGGNIEHFWYEANKDDIEDTLVYSYQAPCPVIADIATDPNGSCLEIGTGKASTMFVVFPIDGELHVGSGSVYSFYQFSWPMSDRLTDSEWQDKLEPKYDPDTFETLWDDVPVQPEWTQSYRLQREK